MADPVVGRPGGGAPGADDVLRVTAAPSYVVAGRRIFTMAPGAEVVDGYLHVQGERVAAVAEGPVPEALSALPRVDAGEMAVLPGFVDPHHHLEQASLSAYGSVDCHAETTGSIDAIVEQLRAHAHTGDARDGWIIGQGNLFMDRRLEDKRYPTREELDRVSQVAPVVLRCGSHVSILNSVALERLYARDFTVRGEAAIELDDTGRPTGVIHEMFHELGVPDLTQEQMAEAITDGARRWLTGNGVTTSGEITDAFESLGVLSSLSRSGAIPQRMDAYVCVPWTTGSIDEAIAIAGRADLAGERFRLNAVKIFVDGGYTAEGAAVLHPYQHVPEDAPNRYGRIAYSEDELAALIRQVDDAGLRLVAHTNGERAQRAVCAAAVALERGDSPPIRLEHAGNYLTDLDTIDHWQRAGAVPVAQAAFIWSMSSFLPDVLGEAGRRGRMPFRSILDRGVDLSFSSDGAASDPTAFSPLFNMQCAVTRTSCTGEEVDKDQALDVMTLLRMHTTAPARAMGLEGQVGALRPGAYADFLLLSEDPTQREDGQLSRVEVRHTFVGGDCVGTAPGV